MAFGRRDRADDSLLTLLGDLPELIRNLVTAEVNAAKSWVGRTAKDAGIGSVWFVVALFFLFWMIPALLAFGIIGLASWVPAWLASLIVVGALFLAIALFALLGLVRFKKALKRDGPAKAVKEDIRLVKEARDDSL